jgi:competence protein ComEC
METSAAETSREIAAWQRPDGGAVTRSLAAILAHQRGHLFPWSAIGLGTGIAVFFSLRFEPNIIDIAILGLVAAAIWIGALFCRLETRPFLWMLALVLLGLVIAGVRTYYVAAPVLGFRYYGPIEGRVVVIDRSSSDKTRLTLDRVRLDRMAPDRTPVRVRVSLHGDQLYLIPKPGMVVAMTGHLSPPSGPVEPGGFDFQRKSWFDRLGAVGYTRSPALRLKPAELSSWCLRLYKFRKSLANGIKARMTGREGPFAAAIVTGDRTDIDQNALADLRGSNLAHLLAISGLHMGLLTGAVLALTRVLLAFWPVTITRFPPKKIAAVVALIAATGYLGVSGASVATQRAFIMAGVMLVAICLDRRALTLRAVTVAALIVLFFHPESLIGPGFQMSFAATVGLVAVFAALRETELMYRLPSWARGGMMLVLSSGIAGLATAPYGAAHFNQMAHYGLFANLISVPVMGFVVMPGAILGAVLWPIGLEWIGLEIMRLGLAWILGVAEIVTDQPGAIRRIAQPSGLILPMITLGGAFLCIWQAKWRILGLLPILVALVIWSQTERPPVLISASGQLIGVHGADGRAVNKPKGDGFTARNWLENDGDGADQATAAERGRLGKKARDVRLGSGLIRYDMSKKLTASEITDLCRGADLLLIPNMKADAACPTLSMTQLRQTGSLAIWPSETGLILDTTNARRGTRIWTSQ